MLNILFSNKNPDQELNRKASILIAIIWSVIAIISLSFIVNMVLQPENISRYITIILLIWTVSAVIIYTINKGFIYYSAFAYVSFLILMIFVFAWTGGGIRGHGIKILPVIVLFAGLTLGKKEIWLFAFIATLGGLVLTLADYYNLLPVSEPLGQSPLIYLIYTATSIFMMCYFENLSVEELRKALTKSEKEIEMRAKYEKLLEEKTEKLIEIAFLQSHQVRRPVANVIGLVSLLNMDNPEDPINVKVIHKIAESSKELDEVIQEIVQKTSDIEYELKHIGERKS